LHFLVKKGFKNDKQSEEIVRDLAVFLIKLTDRHVEQILNQSIALAEISGKPTQNKLIPYDEYGYKHKLTPSHQQPQNPPQYTKLYRLSYQNPMSLYRQIRLNE
jgi:hypothetical protein